MARIRTIKPEFFTDPKIAQLSHGARLLFIAILVHADDYGRFRWNIRWLHGEAFAYDADVTESTVIEWMGSLSEGSLIVPYFLSELLGYVPNWFKHQRINRPSKPLHPDPSDRSEKNGKDRWAQVRASGHSLSPHAIDVQKSALEQGTGNRDKRTPPTVVDAGASATAPRPTRRRRPALPVESEIESGSVLTAADAVAAWVEAVNANGTEPTANGRGKVGRDSRALIAAGNDPALVVEAARQTGVKGWTSVETELQQMHGRSIPKKPRPDQRADQVESLRADMHAKFGRSDQKQLRSGND